MGAGDAVSGGAGAGYPGAMRLVVPALLVACGSAEPAFDRDRGPLTGYAQVRLDLAGTRIDPAEVTALSVGGVPAYDLRADGDALVAWIQGAPEPGPADAVLVAAGERVVIEGAYRFDPPVDPLFDRMYALGASLTQGVQGGVPTRHAQLAGPAFGVARQAGAYFALPLLREDLFPTIEAGDIGPPPDCAVPNVVTFVAGAAVDVLAKINDPEEDRIDFALARATPDLEPRNLAVGGSNVATLVDGPGDDFATGFLAKLVYDVHSDFADPVPASQLDLVEAADPTLIVITDTYGNDLITAIVEGTGIDPDKLTDEALFRDKLGELLDRTAATGAEVFVANIPRVTLLPATEEKVQAAVRLAEIDAENRGEDPVAAAAAEEEAQRALVAEIEAAGERFNAILDELAANHPTVHVVDFAGRVAEIEETGLHIDGQTVTVDKLGGLLSTDGVHFSDTGYAMVANLFLDAIEAELGVAVPRIDLGPVLRADPYSPSNLRAAGLDPEACFPR